MKDDEIDFSDDPELEGGFPADAVIILPEDWENRVTIQVEPEVLAWFRAQGEQSHHKMRAALRIYAQAHQ